jgi:hypothetical protein
MWKKQVMLTEFWLYNLMEIKSLESLSCKLRIMEELVVNFLTTGSSGGVSLTMAITIRIS